MHGRRRTTSCGSSTRAEKIISSTRHSLRLSTFRGQCERRSWPFKRPANIGLEPTHPTVSSVVALPRAAEAARWADTNLGTDFEGGTKASAPQDSDANQSNPCLHVRRDVE